tara:strand:+ start:1195 stop:1485 length:291 start_codon:yes stop_codon:yes gene_type:complete
VKGITTTNSVASCGHSLTGSKIVFAEGGGVSRVGLDGTIIGGGLITGPGSLSVFCEGLPVSLDFDAITAHTPCENLVVTHCAAITMTGTTGTKVGT